MPGAGAAASRDRGRADIRLIKSLRSSTRPSGTDRRRGARATVAGGRPFRQRARRARTRVSGAGTRSRGPGGGAGRGSRCHGPSRRRVVRL